MKQIKQDINNIKQTELKRQKQAEIAEQKSIAEKQKQEAKRKNINGADRLVVKYFEEVTTTSKEGYSYWCPSSYSITLFSPRDYEILDSSVFGNIASYGVRIASRNRGGQSVMNTWKIYLKKENNNWCIALISEAQ